MSSAPAVDRNRRSSVVVLARDGPLTRIIWRALERELGAIPLIVEKPVPVIQFLKRRVKNLGVATVLGQLLFRSTAYPVLNRLGRSRIDTIKREFGLEGPPLDGQIISVPSVNSDYAREVLKDLAPAVVVVSGTRIIGKETLRSVPAIFINMHAGITPRYRGVHGGYWALVEGQPELVGTTVHLVDEGIDTGGVLEQGFFQVSKQDSLATYPYLHVAVGIPLLVKAVRRALDGELETQQQQTGEASKLWYHPTLWGYLSKRLTRGVR